LSIGSTCSPDEEPKEHDEREEEEAEGIWLRDSGLDKTLVNVFSKVVLSADITL